MVATSGAGSGQTSKTGAECVVDDEAAGRAEAARAEAGAVAVEFAAGHRTLTACRFRSQRVLELPRPG